MKNSGRSSRQQNLEDVIKKMPDGLDTMITEHGDNLSGGQKQRISIARAICAKSEKF